MAKHRKQQRLWRRPAYRKPETSSPSAVPMGPPSALRTAATLTTLAGAASAAVLGGTAVADPGPTLAEVEERVDTLHREAEQATEEYNAATGAAREAERNLDRLRDQAARRTEDLNAARDRLGSQAGAQYRAGGLPASLQLALSSEPDDFLRRAAFLDRSGDLQADAVRDIESRLLDIDRLRSEASEHTETLGEARQRARDQREVVRAKLTEAEDLLATRTAEERARLLRDHPTGDAERGAGERSPDLAAAPGARAASAVAFAYAQLGKPYGWGATGPDAYDCSGLTQAAWRAAGVSLPRTSYSQISSGTRVSRSELAPGDLVFFYSGISHVGIYAGGGQIIHASRPGAPVRLAPVDSMPFAGATRPA